MTFPATSTWPGEPRNRGDRIEIPTIWIAVFLSVLLHGLLLWQWAPKLRLGLEGGGKGSPAGSLIVQLAPPPGAPPAGAAVPPARPALPPAADRVPRVDTPRKPAPPRTQPAPPRVLARETPDATAPVVPSAPVAPEPAPPPVPAGDLMARIEARRRARGESAPTVPSAAPGAPATEDDAARADRIAAANLGLDRKPSFGPDPRQGGGVFEIRRMTDVDAEIVFFGWNKDIRRNTAQLIEVRRADNPDMRTAVIRRMIAIVREHEAGDFVWESKRLGRDVTLSARPRDNAGLEDFLMREFFDGTRLVR